MRIASGHVALCALGLSMSAGSAMGQLASWNMNSPTVQPGNQNNMAPTTSAATVTIGGLTRGAGLTAGTANGSFLSTGWSTSATFSSTSTSYVEFTVTAAANQYVTLTSIASILARSSTGASTARWAYQVGGTSGTWIPLQISGLPTTFDIAGISTTATNTSVITRVFNTTSNTTAVPLVISPLSGTVYLRMWGFGATAGTGTMRFTSTGTGSPASLVLNGSAATNQAPTAVNTGPFGTYDPTLNPVVTIAASSAVSATDPESRPLSYALVGNTWANASMTSSGAFSWNIAADSVPNGVYTFTYAATDELGASSNNATFTVEVVPTPGSVALIGLGGLACLRRRR